MMETRLLVRKAKTGDKDALVRLIMLQKSDYYKLAYIYLKNEDDALDAIEDMIVILYERIYKLRKEEAFYSWSKTILVNRCKKIIKERKRVVPLDNSNEYLYTGSTHNKDNKIILDEGISKLNEKYQDVIKLRYFLDLEYKDIAKILNIPLGTVKSRISYGLDKLHVLLGGDKFE